MYKVVFCLLLSCSIFQSFGQVLKTYVDATYGYTIQYPDNWQQKLNEKGRLFITSPLESEGDLFRENINIGASDKKYEAIITFKDFISSLGSVSKTLKENFTNFVLEKENTIKINGKDAYEIIYSGNPNSNPEYHIRIIQRFWISQSHLFTLTYTSSFDNVKWLDDANKMLKSITF